MAVRTLPTEVAEIVEVDESLSLAPFITMASGLTDRVNQRDTEGILTAVQLKSIELLLAAHFYSLRDQQYESQKTGDASATFRGDSGMGLEATTFGQNAILMDVTGTLADLNLQAKVGKKTVTIEWLGKNEPSQFTYDERN